MSRLNRIVITEEQIIKSYNDFIKNEGEKEKLLEEIFKNYKKNTDINIVLTKVTLLNTFYSAGIPNIYLVTMSHKIIDKNIDSRLLKNKLSEDEQIELVNDISCLLYDETETHYLSFASKYCNWHRPDYFPIIDKYLKELLYDYYKNTENRFTKDEFITNENVYRFYYEKLNGFISNYDELFRNKRKKDIDMILWEFAKSLYESNGINL